MLKKMAALLVLAAFLLPTVSFAKIGKSQAGVFAGNISGQGISAFAYGAVIDYGLSDEIDLTGRFDTGSDSGVTANVFSGGAQYNFVRPDSKTTPYVGLGVSSWNFSTGFGGISGSGSGAYFNAGINHAIDVTLNLYIDFRQHSTSFSGVSFNAQQIVGGATFNL